MQQYATMSRDIFLLNFAQAINRKTAKRVLKSHFMLMSYIFPQNYTDILLFSYLAQYVIMC